MERVSGDLSKKNVSEGSRTRDGGGSFVASAKYVPGGMPFKTHRPLSSAVDANMAADRSASDCALAGKINTEDRGAGLPFSSATFTVILPASCAMTTRNSAGPAAGKNDLRRMLEPPYVTSLT